MTAEELRLSAIALFGERGWMSRLAEALGVDRSTVSRWFAGLPIPGPVEASLNAWTKLQALTGEVPSPLNQSPPERPSGGLFHAAGPARSQIMYVEDKSGGLNGPARIGRVYLSKTGKTLTYRGQSFQRSTQVGLKANFFDIETGERYWISNPRKDGRDRLYPGSGGPVEIDDDVREEYWTRIRGRRRDGGPVAN